MRVLKSLVQHLQLFLAFLVALKDGTELNPPRHTSLMLWNHQHNYLDSPNQYQIMQLPCHTSTDRIYCINFRLNQRGKHEKYAHPIETSNPKDKISCSQAHQKSLINMKFLQLCTPQNEASTLDSHESNTIFLHELFCLPPCYLTL